MKDGWRKNLKLYRLELIVFAVAIVMASLAGIIYFQYNGQAGNERVASGVVDGTSLNGTETDSYGMAPPLKRSGITTGTSNTSTGESNSNPQAIGEQPASASVVLESVARSNQNPAPAQTNQNPAPPVNQAGSPPANQDAGMIHVHLTIDSGVRTLDYTEKVQDGATVFQLLQGASQAHGFSIDYSMDDAYGAFIEELDGVRNSPREGKYWMYYVNGQYANLGASTMVLHKGDAILWRYESTL